MYVGVCEMTLHLPESASLKDKRQVVKSVLARLRNQFAVSAAEVAHQEQWQLTTLGISYASGDAQHAREVVEHAARSVEESRPDLLVSNLWLDVLTLRDEDF